MKILLSIFFCIIAVLLYNNESFTTKLQAITDILQNNLQMTSTNTSTETQSFRGLPVIPPNDPSLTKSSDMAVARGIRSVVKAIEQSEGVGARVRRSIGTPKLRNLSPFLMLDHFKVSPG